jgi:hypothetical protein
VTCSAFSIPLPAPLRSYSIPTFFLLLIAFCGFANAEAPKAKPSPCALTDAEAAGLSGDASSDIHVLTDYRNAAHDLLQSRQFRKLDCLANSVRSTKETFPGGMWKIHAIYNGLERPPLHATQEDWKTHIKLLQQWVSLRPHSITAHIALAESLANYGGEARGPGFADTVSQSGWKLFNERTAKAKQVLEQASALPAKDPEWYLAMQIVALYQDWAPGARRELLEKAVKFEPAYYYYYREYANSILPKWGGEEGEVARFMQEAADQMGGDAGDGLYFRVASTVVCGCQSDQQLNLSWPRIQKGFAAVEKQNGPSPENWNQLAHLAVSFTDAVVADKMFARIGDQWSEAIWQNPSALESAKRWAKQAAPYTARRQAAEESAEANLHTPEGQNYNAVFAEKIHTWMQPCLDAQTGGELGKFELLIKVGKEGAVEDFTGSGTSPVMPCLGNKIIEFRQGKQAVFPPPPEANYWMRFDMNLEGSPSAALK